MPIIEEYDVVIKRISVNDLKQIFADGHKDVRVKFTWTGDGALVRTMTNSSMEITIETWEPKKKEGDKKDK